MVANDNQKIVLVCKVEHKRGDNSKFAMLDMASVDKAACALKATSFMLYFYIDKNKTKYEFALSRADFCR